MFATRCKKMLHTVTVLCLTVFTAVAVLERKVETMGYYKQLEITQQADVDRIVQWYRAHAEVLPTYVLEWINERDERLWGLIQRWEKETPAPKPATEHVALQPQTRRDARALTKSSEVIEFSKSDYRVFMGAVIGYGVLSIALLVWIAGLI